MLTCSLPRCAQGGQSTSGHHDGQIHPLSAASAMKGCDAPSRLGSSAGDGNFFFRRRLSGSRPRARLFRLIAFVRLRLCGRGMLLVVSPCSTLVSALALKPCPLCMLTQSSRCTELIERGTTAGSSAQQSLQKQDLGAWQGRASWSGLMTRSGPLPR